MQSGNTKMKLKLKEAINLIDGLLLLLLMMLSLLLLLILLLFLLFWFLL